jgi:hypothetical protein
VCVCVCVCVYVCTCTLSPSYSLTFQPPLPPSFNRDLRDSETVADRDTKRNKRNSATRLSPTPALAPVSTPAPTPVSLLKLDLSSITSIGDAFKVLEKNLSATVSPRQPRAAPRFPLRREEDVPTSPPPDSEKPKHQMVAKEMVSPRIVRRNSKDPEEEEEEEFDAKRLASSPRFTLPFWNEWRNS